MHLHILTNSLSKFGLRWALLLKIDHPSTILSCVAVSFCCSTDHPKLSDKRLFLLMIMWISNLSWPQMELTFWSWLELLKHLGTADGHFHSSPSGYQSSVGWIWWKQLDYVFLILHQLIHLEVPEFREQQERKRKWRTSQSIWTHLLLPPRPKQITWPSPEFM